MAQVITGSLDGHTIASGDFTFSLGGSAGSGTITFPTTGYTIANKSTLVLSDNERTITLNNMYVTGVRDTFDAQGGRHLTCSIYDRRWEWQWGYVNGIYNELDYNGLPKQEKTLQQLFELIFTAINETNYIFVGMEGYATTYPEVNWEFENPGEAINSLCDKYGVTLGLSTDNGGRFVICPMNYERDFPGGTSSMTYEHAEVGVLLPNKIILVGARAQVQEQFKDLIPVGEDIDGSVKPINQLSFSPTTQAPEEEEYPYKAWGDALRDCFTNLATEQEKLLAEKCIFKWYSIDFYLEETVNGQDVLVYDPELILPLLSEISDVEVVEGKTDHAKPYVLAETTEWDGTEFKTVAFGKITDGYSIDKKLGIVKFNDPTVKTVTANGPVSGGFTWAVVDLVAAYEVKAGTTDDFIYYEQAVTGGTEMPAVHKENSMVPWYKIDPDTNVEILTNATDLDNYAAEVMTLLLGQYINQSPEIRVLPGVYAVGAYGLIRSVRVSIDEANGAETEIQKGIEIPKLNIDKYEERLNKKMVKTSVKNMVNSRMSNFKLISKGAGNSQKYLDYENPNKNMYGVFHKYSKELKRITNTLNEDILPKSFMQVDGIDETTQLYKLKKYDGSNAPIVIAQHGLTAQANGVAHFDGINVVAKKAGEAIVIGDKVNPEVGGVEAVKDDAGQFVVVAIKNNDLYVRPFGGGGAAGLLMAKVIEAPEYADPASFSLSSGRAYYTLRLEGTAENVYVPETTYVDDTLVCYPNANSTMYKAKHPEGNLDPNVGHQPDTSTDWWEKQDEIKVTAALGNTGKDLRLFNPWFEVGKLVPVISRLEDEEIVWYIDFCLQYRGTNAQASTAWNQTENRVMSCFK